MELQPSQPRRNLLDAGGDAREPIRPGVVRGDPRHSQVRARGLRELATVPLARKPKLVFTPKLVVADRAVRRRLVRHVECQSLPKPDPIRPCHHFKGLGLPLDVRFGHFEAHAFGRHTEGVTCGVPARVPKAVARQCRDHADVEMPRSPYSRLNRGGGRQSIVPTAPPTLDPNEPIRSRICRGK